MRDAPAGECKREGDRQGIAEARAPSTRRGAVYVRLAEGIESDLSAVPDPVRVPRTGLNATGVEPERDKPTDAKAKPPADAVVAEPPAGPRRR